MLFTEAARAQGIFTAWFVDKDGNLCWVEEFENTVVTAGKNLALDTYLAGSAYTVVGPYLGLISSVGYSAIAAGDTMTSHPGWTEFTGYSGSRATAAWSAAAAGAKAFSGPAAFSINAAGTVKGGFLVFGSGALATPGNTGGTLYSAGLFSGGDQPVTSGGTLSVSYTASL